MQYSLLVGILACSASTHCAETTQWPSVEWALKVMAGPGPQTDLPAHLLPQT